MSNDTSEVLEITPKRGNKAILWVAALAIVIGIVVIAAVTFRARTQETPPAFNASGERVFEVNGDVMLARLTRDVDEAYAARLAELKAAGSGQSAQDLLAKRRALQLNDIPNFINYLVNRIADEPYSELVESVNILQYEGVAAAIERIHLKNKEMDAAVARFGNNKKVTRKIREVRRLEAKLLECQLRYDKALAIHEAVANEDETWASVHVYTGNMLVKFAEATEGTAKSDYLQRAKFHFNNALAARPDGYRSEYWAWLQGLLGNTCIRRGELVTGEEKLREMGDAVAAYRAAVTVKTKSKRPEEWSYFQHYMGYALVYQANLTGGEKGRAFLKEGIEAYRAALTARAKEKDPDDYAETQYRLGRALSLLSECAPVPERLRAAQDAEVALREAANTYSSKDSPEKKAIATINLGDNYSYMARLKKNEESPKLFEEAMKCYQATLRMSELDEDKEMQAAAHVCVAFSQLFEKEFEKSLASSEAALRLDPTQVTTHTNHAHALLFLGHVEEAKAEYSKYATNDPVGRRFAKNILEDFTRLENFGVTHPEVEGIRAMMKDRIAPVAAQ